MNASYGSMIGRHQQEQRRHQQEQRMTTPNYTPHDSIPLIFIMGPTNVGKSTLMTAASIYGTGEEPSFSTITNELTAHGLLGLVEVGKKMRAKYPPEHFKGQGAPAHTQAEAWDMMLDGIREASHRGKVAVVIDGQPRNTEQTHWALDMPNPKTFLVLNAPPEVREQRARKRDANDPAKWELTQRRLIDDPRALFDCLCLIKIAHAHLTVHDTTSLHYDPERALTEALADFGYDSEDEDTDDRRAGECGGEGNVPD